MTNLDGLVKRLCIPAGRVVPHALAFADLRAHAITRHDLHDDVEGINASMGLIRRTRGGEWPREAVTEEFNYVDLVWHECEFRNNDSFTYVLRDASRGYLGCCYLYPLGRRTPLSAKLLAHDVDVSWWVTESAYRVGWYEKTFLALQTWMNEIPFAAPYYSNAEIPRL